MEVVKPPEIQIREYHAIINQSGTNAPIATILHNTLEGIPIWTRDSVGSYTITLEGQFPTGKTTTICTSAANTAILGMSNNFDDNSIYLLQRSMTETGFPQVDGLYETSVIIRVYNI